MFKADNLIWGYLPKVQCDPTTYINPGRASFKFSTFIQYFQQQERFYTKGFTPLNMELVIDMVKLVPYHLAKTPAYMM